jgi:hypothetical protein
MRHCDSDGGAFAVPGIVKIAIAMAVLGVLGYDGFFTVATHLKTENDAQNAAYAASAAWQDAAANTRTAEVAYQAAVTYLASNQPSDCMDELTESAKGVVPSSIPVGCDFICTGASNQSQLCGSHGSFTVDPTGTVHLIIRRQAKTLVFGHIGFMHSLLVAYEAGDANQADG